MSFKEKCNQLCTYSTSSIYQLFINFAFTLHHLFINFHQLCIYPTSSIYQLLINFAFTLHHIFINFSSSLHLLYIIYLSTFNQLCTYSTSFIYHLFINFAFTLHHLFINFSSTLPPPPATEESDWPVSDTEMHVIWARGQQTGDVIHRPQASIEAGEMSDSMYYR